MTDASREHFGLVFVDPVAIDISRKIIDGYVDLINEWTEKLRDKDCSARSLLSEMKEVMKEAWNERE